MSKEPYVELEYNGERIYERSYQAGKACGILSCFGLVFIVGFVFMVIGAVTVVQWLL